MTAFITVRKDYIRLCLGDCRYDFPVENIFRDPDDDSYRIFCCDSPFDDVDDFPY